MAKYTKFKDTLTAQEIEELINLVKKHPCLYNSHLPEYKDNLKKDKSWIEIAQKLKKPVLLCKSKWKHLRDYYKKIKKESKTNCPSTQRLKFLDVLYSEEYQDDDTSRVSDYQAAEEPSSPGGDGTSEPMEEQDNEADADNEYDVFKSEPQDMREELLDPTFNPSSYDMKFHFVNAHDDEDDKEEVKKTSHSKRSSKSLPTPSKNPNQSVSSSFNSKNASSIDLFFQSMAETVKTFSPKTVAEVKVKICNIVSECEIKELRNGLH